MHAIISDLHGNIQALETVFEDIRSRGIERVICLGDVVGYGADPEPCIDLVEERCDFCLSGNHDYAVVTMPVQFNPLAEEAVAYAKARLTRGALSLGRKRSRWHWLEGLPTRREEDGVLYVHGSPRDDRNEYVLQTDILFGNLEKVQEIFDLTPRLLFIGHSHVPGIITEEMEFLEPPTFDYRYTLDPERKYLVNVGSVGQPRDGDSRSCYLVVDEDELMYCRIPYDIGQAMERMASIGPISSAAASRLQFGR